MCHFCHDLSFLMRTYFSGFNRSCVQEAGHFDLFVSDSVGIVVSIIRSTLPVLLTLPALLATSKTMLGYIKFCNVQKMIFFFSKFFSINELGHYGILFLQNLLDNGSRFLFWSSLVGVQGFHQAEGFLSGPIISSLGIT